MMESHTVYRVDVDGECVLAIDELIRNVIEALRPFGLRTAAYVAAALNMTRYCDIGRELESAYDCDIPEDQLRMLEGCRAAADRSLKLSLMLQRGQADA